MCTPPKSDSLVIPGPPAALAARDKCPDISERREIGNSPSPAIYIIICASILFIQSKPNLKYKQLVLAIPHLNKGVGTVRPIAALFEFSLAPPLRLSL
jgi:hypothetical protein